MLSDSTRCVLLIYVDSMNNGALDYICRDSCTTLVKVEQ